MIRALPWFQRFIFIIFIAKGRGKINLWNILNLWYKGSGVYKADLHHATFV
jgi:hypothetical protein